MKKILFISHDASRTGAPILLLRLIEQIKNYANFEVLILLKNEGELKEDFEKLGKTYLWNGHIQQAGFLEIFKERFCHKIGIKRLTAKQKYHLAILKEINEADIIFNNTITNAALLKDLSIKGKKIFSYFHELHLITQSNCSKEDIAYLNDISEKIFVPSKAVKNFLIKDYNISPDRIAFLRYVIPEPKYPAKNSDIAAKKVIHDAKAFLIGFCGTIHWRKGYELLPLLAKRIVSDKKITGINFVWIGANKNSNEYLILKNDLEKLGLISYFTFIQPEKDIEPYLCQLDVLVLPSREDAFPLVVLEAAHYEVPCVYFSNAGGIGEFLGSDAGIAVEYLDIDGMADAIIGLKQDADYNARLGKRAKEKIIEYSKPREIAEGLLQYFNNSSN